MRLILVRIKSLIMLFTRYGANMRPKSYVCRSEMVLVEGGPDSFFDEVVDDLFAFVLVIIATVAN